MNKRKAFTNQSDVRLSSTTPIFSSFVSETTAFTSRSCSISFFAMVEASFSMNRLMIKEFPSIFVVVSTDRSEEVLSLVSIQVISSNSLMSSVLQLLSIQMALFLLMDLLPILHLLLLLLLLLLSARKTLRSMIKEVIV